MMLPFFEWCEDTYIATAINNSVWAFPVIEAVHLVGLCALGGAVLIVDLRMLGVGLRHHGISELVSQYLDGLADDAVHVASDRPVLLLTLHENRDRTRLELRSQGAISRDLLRDLRIERHAVDTHPAGRERATG